MNAFFRDFQSGIADAGRALGEPWTWNGTEYPSIAIESLSAADIAILGGRFADVSTVIHITGAVSALSGVKEGSVINARGTALRVLTIATDGDNNPVLHCGPVGIRTPHK